MSIPLPGRILPFAPTTFRALRHRNFRLLWTGQLVSLSGSWMQSVAQGWLVLRLSDSPFQLGLVGFFTFLPVLLFALLAGAAADRLPRRAKLMWIQGASMALALLLAGLTWLDRVQVWHVAILAFGVGAASTFDIPIRQSLLQDLVGREDLPNAIALNSLAFNAARLLGPALGGILLARLGEAAVFLINAVSYLAVLAGLGLMRLPQPRIRVLPSSWAAEIRRGLAWAMRSPRARVFLALVVVSSIFGLPYSILLPVFARDILEVGSRGLGIMTAATGLGAVAGALLLAGRVKQTRRGRVVAGAMSVLGASLIGFAISGSFWLSLLLLFFIGSAMIVQLATTNTLLQLLAPADLRGRIVSLYMLAFLGMAPLGSLLAGAAARSLGAPAAVLGGGAVCLVIGLWFAARLPALRRRSEIRGEPAAGSAGPDISAGGSPRRSRWDP